MPQLKCTVRRIGDHESRTEEYEVAYTVGQATPRGLEIRYQAARAYEINSALDRAVGVAREVIGDNDPGHPGPRDEALFKFSWRAIQSAKYEEGEPVFSALDY